MWFARKSQIYHLVYVLLLHIVFQLALTMDAGQVSNGSKELGSMKQSAGWRREWKVDQNICKMWNWKRRLGSGHSEIFIFVEKMCVFLCISLPVIIGTLVVIQILHQLFAQLIGVSFCSKIGVRDLGCSIWILITLSTLEMTTHGYKRERGIELV